jgi:hypothetical protein
MQDAQGSTTGGLDAASVLAPVGASVMGAAMSFSPVLGTGLALAAGGAGLYDVGSAVVGRITRYTPSFAIR